MWEAIGYTFFLLRLMPALPNGAEKWQIKQIATPELGWTQSCTRLWMAWENWLSAGNDHDSTHAVQLVNQVNTGGSCGLAGWAYGAASIRIYIGEHGASYVVPPKAMLLGLSLWTGICYKERHLVVCFFQKSNGFAELRPDIISSMLFCCRPSGCYCYSVNLRNRWLKQGKSEHTVDSSAISKGNRQYRVRNAYFLHPLHSKRAQWSGMGCKEPPALASIYRFVLAKSTCNRSRFFRSPR